MTRLIQCIADDKQRDLHENVILLDTLCKRSAAQQNAICKSTLKSEPVAGWLCKFQRCEAFETARLLEA
jgi:hypothetical protein